MANLHLTQEKLDALRSEYKQRNSPLKYPRPKTKPEYQLWYPWLLPDDIDPHFVFCTVCECRLSAKRSDLGKHEGSIKHTENSQRKGLLSSKPSDDTDNATAMPEVKWEYNEDQFAEDNLLPFSASTSQVEKTEMATEEESGEVSDEVDAENEEIDDEDGFSYEPLNKRRASDTDSQHSNLLDFLPLQVTINESPPNATFMTGGIANGSASQNSTAMPPQYKPSPCRITIKKVTAPLVKPVHNTQHSEITTKATITPISGSYALPPPNQQQQSQQQNQQTTATTSQHPTQPQTSHQKQQTMYTHNITAASAFSPALTPMRDSFDLFFDSICATVKSLPPKLATEGKIRVMQLIGELEMRAITDREALQSVANGGTTTNCTTAAAGQQNATVASTTK